MKFKGSLLYDRMDSACSRDGKRVRGLRVRLYAIHIPYVETAYLLSSEVSKDWGERTVSRSRSVLDSALKDWQAIDAARLAFLDRYAALVQETKDYDDNQDLVAHPEQSEDDFDF